MLDSHYWCQAGMTCPDMPKAANPVLLSPYLPFLLNQLIKLRKLCYSSALKNLFCFHPVLYYAPDYKVSISKSTIIALSGNVLARNIQMIGMAIHTAIFGLCIFLCHQRTDIYCCHCAAFISGGRETGEFNRPPSTWCVFPILQGVNNTGIQHGTTRSAIFRFTPCLCAHDPSVAVMISGSLSLPVSVLLDSTSEDL